MFLHFGQLVFPQIKIIGPQSHRYCGPVSGGSDHGLFPQIGPLTIGGRNSTKSRLLQPGRRPVTTSRCLEYRLRASSIAGLWDECSLAIVRSMLSVCASFKDTARTMWI